MEQSSCISWSSLATPGSASYAYTVVNGILYAYGAGNELWQVASGASLGAFSSSWQPVVSFYSSTPTWGLMAIGPQPLGWFGNHVYGALRSASSFDVYRSPDSGSQYMTWELVASNGFGDAKNRNIAFILQYNGKVVAGTTETRSSMFGDPSGFGTGVEIWESSTGASGSWTQVSADGFGTETTIVGSSTTLRTNQDIGSAEVFGGYLWVGTKSHYGAEVWRYGGGGTAGWTNMTPSWAGVCDLGCGPGRNEAMAVFQGQLYLGEGYPTGNLATTTGSSWTIEVNGTHPFSSSNGGVKSLAVLGGVLYAATLHSPYSGVTQGDQVWATPAALVPPICSKPSLPFLGFDPPKIRFVVPASRVELRVWFENLGDGPYAGGGMVELSRGETLLVSQDLRALEPRESVEVAVELDLLPGENLLSLTLEPGRSGEGQPAETLRFSLAGGR